MSSLPRGWSARDWRDEYRERAAIREHCGGLARADAEAFAFGDLVGDMLHAATPAERMQMRARLERALGLAG